MVERMHNMCCINMSSRVCLRVYSREYSRPHLARLHLRGYHFCCALAAFLNAAIEAFTRRCRAEMSLHSASRARATCWARGWGGRGGG